MQMRRPAAVLHRSTELRKFGAPRHRRTGRLVRKRVRRQMAIDGPEAMRRIGLMFQDQDAAETARHGINCRSSRSGPASGARTGVPAGA